MKKIRGHIIYNFLERLALCALAVSFILSFAVSAPVQQYTLSERTHPLELVFSQPHSEFILTAVQTPRTDEKIVHSIGDGAFLFPKSSDDVQHAGVFTFHSSVATTSLLLRLIYTQITSSCL